MSHTSHASTGGDAPTLASTKVVALYDKTDGRIRHLHIVNVFDGAAPVTEDEAVSTAQRLAARRQGDIAALGVAVSDDREHGQLPHRIDPASGRFVKIAASRRG